MIGYKAGKKVENSQFPGNQNLEDFKAYIFELIDIYFQLNCAFPDQVFDFEYKNQRSSFETNCGGALTIFIDFRNNCVSVLVVICTFT